MSRVELQYLSLLKISLMLSFSLGIKKGDLVLPVLKTHTNTNTNLKTRDISSEFSYIYKNREIRHKLSQTSLLSQLEVIAKILPVLNW